MKTKVLLLLLAILSVIATVITNLEIVDNRDYPEDGLEVYLYNTHVGYLYPDGQIEYILTGK